MVPFTLLLLLLSLVPPSLSSTTSIAIVGAGLSTLPRPAPSLTIREGTTTTLFPGITVTYTGAIPSSASATVTIVSGCLPSDALGAPPPAVPSPPCALRFPASSLADLTAALRAVAFSVNSSNVAPTGLRRTILVNATTASGDTAVAFFTVAAEKVNGAPSPAGPAAPRAPLELALPEGAAPDFAVVVARSCDGVAVRAAGACSLEGAWRDDNGRTFNVSRAGLAGTFTVGPSDDWDAAWGALTGAAAVSWRWMHH